MTHKAFFFDIESGGVDYKTDALITLSGFIATLQVTNDGKLKILNSCSPIDIKTKPLEGKNISDEALTINGITREEIETYDEPEVAFEKLQTYLDSHIFKFDKKDKAILVGYNVSFDINFLSEWYKHFDPYFGSYINWKKYDIYQKVQELWIRGKLGDLPNLKLATVCNYFGIEFDAHNSLSDIYATKTLMVRLEEL